jgi:hypothetical protein
MPNPYSAVPNQAQPTYFSTAREFSGFELLLMRDSLHRPTLSLQRRTNNRITTGRKAMGHHQLAPGENPAGSAAKWSANVGISR